MFDITDRKALSALSPTAVSVYLRARGWSVIESDTSFAVFERLEGEDRFADAVQAGVTANYCDALARLLEEDEGRNIVLSFSWAPSRPVQGPTPSRLAFSRTDAEILRAATTAGGEVTIAGLVDGGIRQVSVSLAGDDYQRAVQAHHQELEVSVEGELLREGRSYRLDPPPHVCHCRVVPICPGYRPHPPCELTTESRATGRALAGRPCRRTWTRSGRR